MGGKRPRGAASKKTGGAVFVVILSAVLLLARAGFVPFSGGGGVPDAAEMREEAVPWQKVWEAPEDFRGETTAVTGTVAGAAYLPGVDGRPTFLNLGNPHPRTPRFEILIWGEHRNRFLSAAPLPPEDRYRKQRICAAGTVAIHEGIPQIEIRKPRQLVIAEEP
jgi:hypothetical protein